VLLAGCATDNEPPAPPPEPKSLAGSPPSVEAALLTTAELGEGWVDLGATPFEQRGLAACPPTNVLTAQEDDRRLGEAQTHHRQGDEDPAPVFFESISLWESPEAAEASLSEFGTAPTVCTGGTHRTPDGREAQLTFDERPAPELGEQAVAQVLRFDFQDTPDQFVDLIAVRLGDVVVLTNGERFEGNPDSSLDTDRLDELTRRAVEKVEGSLPLR
jgi:hypothetical protein